MHTPRHSSFLVLASLLLSSPGAAGQGTLNPQSFLRDAELTEQYVFQADVDADGRVWVASPSGLIRYDGYRWSTYTVEDGLPSDFVRAVVVDREAGELWVGTSRGIVVFSLASMKAERSFRDELAGPNVRRIRLVDDDVWVCSDTWITGSEAGLARYDRNTGAWRTFTMADGLPTDYVMDFYRTDGGEEFALTASGLARREGDRFVEAFTPPGEPKNGATIWSMTTLPDGVPAITTTKGLFVRDEGSEWRQLVAWNVGNPQLMKTRAGELVLPLRRWSRILFLRPDDYAGVETLRTLLDRDASKSESELARRSLLPFPPQLSDPRVEDLVEADDGGIWIVGSKLLMRWLSPSVIESAKWREWSTDARPSFTVNGLRWRTVEGGFEPVEPVEPEPPREKPPLPPPPPELSKRFVEKVDEEGATWIFGMGGLFRCPAGGHEWEPVRVEASLHVYSVTFAGGSVWYIAHGPAGRHLERWRDGVVDAFPIDTPSYIGLTRGQRPIYNVDGGVCIVPVDGGDPYLIRTPPAHDALRGVWADDGALWLASQNSYLRFRPEGRPPDTTCRAHAETVLEGTPLVVEVEVDEWMTPRDRAGQHYVSTRLDDGPWTPFAPLSHGGLEIKDVAAGEHVLQVRGRDEGLNFDPSPAEIHFRVTQAGIPHETVLLAAAALAAVGAFATLLLVLRRRTARLHSLRDLLRTANEAIVVVARDGRIEHANSAGLTLLGLSREKLGHVLLEATFENPERARNLLARLRTTGRVEGFDCRLRAEPPETRSIQLTAVPLPEGGWQLLLQDVTREVTIEEQLYQARKLETIGQLAGGVAHDFNNLLVGILGNVGLALEHLGPDSPARVFVERIKRSGKRAQELSDQMLAYSGKGKFVIETIDLDALIQEMVELLETAISKKARLELDLRAKGSTIEGDATQIRQVVMNLITNASDALGEGDGVVSVSTEVADDNVILTVSDTGCGMDDVTRGRIFDPFFTTKFTGRGLGLAAAMGIVRSHEGTITVSSEPGRGTTFRVELPIVESRAPAVPVTEPETSEWTGRGTVLVVDDDVTVRLVAQDTLRSRGLEVLMAEDGVQALEIFRERPDDISVVLLDLLMPRMDGGETCRALREIRPDVRVVLTSGYGEQQAFERFSIDGLAGFLKKPYFPDDLVRAIRNVLDGANLGRDAAY